ncbi:ABC transporter ATP-binding protein [Telluribacter humicola]|uniref:ABC transporter ATP-binding protein n=1 Tax=Telluribacter humicola TaxID=1720261 RepID=UPI001A971BDC|nr:ABC transporter ATP-binding protein [Telluribacter humicola]
MPIIKTHQLTKRFGQNVAIDALSLHVNPGEIYGFLGLNGAGKTTLIRMLLGMIKPDEGSITVMGQPLHPGFDQWNEVGYLVETPYSYPNLSVEENLRVYYKLRQLRDPNSIDTIIEQLKLSKYRNTKAKVLSLGNQQRLGLAKALMHQPRLLILDEPINGLDPEGIVEVRELLIQLAQQGSTIFLSSHILSEIARIAHRIGIIHEGRLVKELTTGELTDNLIRKLIVHTQDNTLALYCLTEAGYPAVLTDRNEIEINDRKAFDCPESISRLLVEKGLPPRQMYMFTEDLEAYFLRSIRHT